MTPADALARLDPAHAAYLEGGAGDEITLRANRQAWQDMALWPRSLRPLAGSHTRIELLGRSWPTPLLVAPMAHQGLAHPQGETGTALAAAALGIGLVLSCQASQRLEDVARPVHTDTSRGPLWFQLYLQPQRTDTLALVQRAEAAGFEALVLTIDAPVQGVRDRELLAGFRLPPGLSAVNLPPPAAEPLDALLARAATADDIAWLRSQTRLPILLKGVLHPSDAADAVALGIDGLIVSNHGGRTLDTAVTTARALPAVVEAVAGAVPVLVDGGVRRGTDVLKALALGA
uniref:alpha-hydroxy acid oxidase n=1 Tax=uncultured Hydrogenophaga sp. TaxID=199683 RepID=UPI00265FDE96